MIKQLSTIKNIVEKSKHSAWKDHENGHLPGIVSKLNKVLQKKPIDKLVNCEAKELLNTVKEITSQEQQKTRGKLSSLLFHKPRERADLTQELMTAIKEGDYSSLIRINSTVSPSQESGSHFSMNLGGDDDL